MVPGFVLMRRAFLWGAGILFGFVGLVTEVQAFSPETVGFRVRVRDEVCSFRVMAVFTLPGEVVDFKLEGSRDPGRVVATPSDPGFETLRPGQWRLRSPDTTGLYRVSVTDTVVGDSMSFHVFVMVPFEKQEGEYLNGYRMGRYPKTALKGLAIYKPPRGFIEVTRENRSTKVSPHFRLSQFVCKQAGEYPKYVVVQERLLYKLEAVLARVNEAGYRCNTLAVLSGYRTPYYNRAIGNVQYSRHVWGGAADVYIDRDENGFMDDLDGNGEIDYRDAQVLYGLVDSWFGKPWYKPFVGGLGRYGKTSTHGPFVHLDVRGFRARWGT